MTTYDENGFLCGRISDWIALQKVRHKDLLVRAYELNRDCHHFLDARAVQVNDGKQVALSLLFARKLELYQSIIIVSERGMSAATRIVFRAFLEACFHFFAIHRDATYLNDYTNQFHINKRKLLKRIRESTSHAMAELRHGATDELVQATERAIRENGAREIHIKDVSKRAEMYDTYLTAYAMLSPAVHTAASDVDDHIVLDASTGETSFAHGPTDTETLKAICLTGMTLAEALKVISRYFNEDRDTVCTAHIEMFQSFLSRET